MDLAKGGEEWSDGVTGCFYPFPQCDHLESAFTAFFFTIACLLGWFTKYSWLNMAYWGHPVTGSDLQQLQ